MKLDEIGNWSEIKLDIVKKYADAYSKILAKQPRLKHIYIDAFAGAGEHLSKRDGHVIPGSPRNALDVQPRFSEYHFIDHDSEKLDHIANSLNDEKNVTLHYGDCNVILEKHLLPQITYESYRRALCLLDPYGLTLDWKVVQMAGQLGTVEIFLNFPVMDMNRNALRRDVSKVESWGADAMNAFWGDEGWKEVVYLKQGNLFGADDQVKRRGNTAIVDAYRERLQKIAGFKYVPEPIRMRIPQGAVVYYLFFAGPNETGARIARALFKKYKPQGAT